jgi:hypothetical protein
MTLSLFWWMDGWMEPPFLPPNKFLGTIAKSLNCPIENRKQSRIIKNQLMIIPKLGDNLKGILFPTEFKSSLQLKLRICQAYHIREMPLLRAFLPFE